MAPNRYNGSTVTPLLVSKLTVPAAPPAMIDRYRLYDALDMATCGPVVLLSAPAGWGKTTLLSGWVRDRCRESAVAWLTLEPGDRGDRFWWYVSAALDGAAASRSEGHSIPVPGSGPAEHYLARMAATLTEAREPAVLVLDDFHQMSDHRILAGLAFLVRHAGTRLRLVLSTRIEPALPLHRWRVDGELTELRARELAFTPAETRALLAGDGHSLQDAQLTALHTKTQGWPAGVRLAALALRSRPDHDQFLEEFTGDHGMVAEYLWSEVLSALPPKVRRVLLRASVLTQLNGRLVDALTGRKDGDQILADVARRNSFLFPVDGRTGWYAYQPLFGELLASELRRRAPETVPVLHRRAASWHAANGWPVAALRHALAAQDWAGATDLFGAYWPDLMLCSWFDGPYVGAPPPPSDVLEADPELTLAYATHRLNLGDRSGARTFLDLAQQRLSLAEDRIERLGLIADALRLTEAQLGGDVDTVQSYAPQVLARVPSPPNADRRGDESARAVAFAALGTARQNIGDIDAAEEALSHGLVAARHAGLTCQMWECTAHLALLHAMRGESHAAERAARAVLSAAACHQCQTTAAGHAYLTMTSVCWERDQLDDAGRYLDLAADCCGSGSDPLLRGALTIFRARLFDACGDPAQAEKVLAEGRRELTDRNSSHYLRCWMTATEADLITRRGDTDTARRLLAPLLEDPDAGSPLLTVTLARTFLADGDPAAALRLLHDWAGDETSGRSLSLRLEGGVLETMAASSAGDDRRAESLLEYVLGMAVRENARRVFVDAGPALRTLLLRHLDSGTAHWSMIMELLEATRAQPDPAPDPPPGEPLSSREATVLRYLQSTLTNSEIAAELSVSVHTVKTHLRNIYRKLGVPHRRAAVRSARARQLI